MFLRIFVHQSLGVTIFTHFQKRVGNMIVDHHLELLEKQKNILKELIQKNKIINKRILYRTL